MKIFRIEILGDGGPPTHKKTIGNDSPCQYDQFYPKNIESGAILAIFRPFEIFRNFSLPWAVNHMNQNMKQLNPRLQIFKRPKNREDSSDFDDFRSKQIVSSLSISRKTIRTNEMNKKLPKNSSKT